MIKSKINRSWKNLFKKMRTFSLMKKPKTTKSFSKKCKNASATILKRIDETAIVLIMMKEIWKWLLTKTIFLSFMRIWEHPFQTSPQNISDREEIVLLQMIISICHHFQTLKEMLRILMIQKIIKVIINWIKYASQMIKITWLKITVKI